MDRAKFAICIHFCLMGLSIASSQLAMNGQVTKKFSDGQHLVPSEPRSVSHHQISEGHPVDQIHKSPFTHQVDQQHVSNNWNQHPVLQRTDEVRESQSMDSNNNIVQPPMILLDSTRHLSSDPTELGIGGLPQAQSSSQYQVEYQSGRDNMHTHYSSIPELTTSNSTMHLSSTIRNNFNEINLERNVSTIEQSSDQSGSKVEESSGYFFSSSEKLPNHKRASNAWWAIGVGNEFERASNLTQDNYLDYCSKSELLTSNKQRSLCRSNARIMPIVARGLKMAIDECQVRFAPSRWNCSLAIKEGRIDETGQVFGDFMKQRLAHAMTKACSQGEMPEECSCDKRIKLKNNRGNTEWVACSDDVEFGARFSREFTENFGLEPETTSMINLHNYEVGRRVFKSATDIKCACPGGEASLCPTKRCWRHMGQFGDIGEELARRYEGATHVQPSQRDPHKLRPVRRGVRKPKRKDLVFIDESPDYCSQDTRIGVLGTQNRGCNSTSSGPDSCSLLCCGRGYQVVVEEIEEDCNCEFVWCCELKCKKCRRRITNDVCN